MVKKKRTYNPNLIRSKRSYTFREIAGFYDVHIRTVQSWRKLGLKVIEGSFSPYLIKGEDLRQFLKTKRQKHKRKLGLDEFYCTKCHSPRKSLPDKLAVEYTNKSLGKKYKQVVIKGVCEVCDKPLFRFSSDRIIEEMKKKGVLFEEHKEGLNGNEYTSLNTDIEQEEGNVESECSIVDTIALFKDLHPLSN